MTVAHVLPWTSRNAGGLLESVSGLVKALALIDGLRVEVYGAQDAFSDADRVHWQPVPVHTAPVLGPARFSFTPGLGPLLARSRPALIHSAAVWTWQAVLVNRIHARRRTPYLVSTRGTLEPWALARSRTRKALALALYQRRNLARASCIHALTTVELDSVRRFGLRTPVCVIPNGVDLPDIDRVTPFPAAHPLAATTTDPARRLLLYLGRLHPKKGLAHLVRAWASARAAGTTRGALSDWRLALAGWDECGHEAELRALCAALGVTDSVRFVGPQFGDAKRACLANCAAFILPSLSEGMPMAVLEAWAYGKPALITPQCNLPEGYSAGAAFRIEPEPDAIAQGLRRLAATPGAALADMGRRARRLVTDRFAWPRIARDMKAVYDWVLDGGATPDTVHLA